MVDHSAHDSPGPHADAGASSFPQTPSRHHTLTNPRHWHARPGFGWDEPLIVRTPER